MGRKQKSLQTSHKLYKPLGRFNRNPGRLITLSFLAVILTGALLLMMPFSLPFWRRFSLQLRRPA